MVTTEDQRGITKAYQGNEPCQQKVLEELCRCNYKLQVSEWKAGRVQWIVCHAGSWNPKKICWDVSSLTRKRNQKIKCDGPHGINTPSFEFLVEACVKFTKSDRKRHEKPSEKDYDEQKWWDKINGHSTERDDHLREIACVICCQ